MKLSYILVLAALAVALLVHSGAATEIVTNDTLQGYVEGITTDSNKLVSNTTVSITPLSNSRTCLTIDEYIKNDSVEQASVATLSLGMWTVSIVAEKVVNHYPGVFQEVHISIGDKNGILGYSVMKVPAASQ